MTDRKHLKSRVRARMAHTDERYAAARLHVSGDAAMPVRDAPAPAPSPSPGINPATTALVAMLARVGLPIPEPLALVVGGGIGIGIFQFHYAKEGMSSFFVAGRHRWEDDTAFLANALGRVGLTSIVDETTSPRVAERQLRVALADGGTVVAWVDAAELETRALPDEERGGAYHVLIVRGIDHERDLAQLDDLSSAPLEVPLDILARARSRIAKDRNRLLRVGPTAIAWPTALPDAIRSGLRATVDGLHQPRSRPFGVDALTDWSDRLRSDGKDGWGTVFPAGARLWAGLAAIHRSVEHHGSGGGLMRPLFADGLRLAAASLENPALAAVALRYDDLGRAWSDPCHGGPPIRRPGVGTDASARGSAGGAVPRGRRGGARGAGGLRAGDVDHSFGGRRPLAAGRRCDDAPQARPGRSDRCHRRG